MLGFKKITGSVTQRTSNNEGITIIVNNTPLKFYWKNKWTQDVVDHIANGDNITGMGVNDLGISASLKVIGYINHTNHYSDYRFRYKLIWVVLLLMPFNIFGAAILCALIFDVLHGNIDGLVIYSIMFIFGGFPFLLLSCIFTQEYYAGRKVEQIINKYSKQ